MKCDAEFVIGECHGVHVGKFRSCRDEAVYWLALEDSMSYGGDPDYGSASLVCVANGDPYSGEPCHLEDGVTAVKVLGGWYIVYSTTSGSVEVTWYVDEVHARATFDVWHDAFQQWAADARNGD